MDLQGHVVAGEVAIAGATVVVSDEGVPLGGAITDAEGGFVVAGLADAARFTVRAVHPDHGADQEIVVPGEDLELSLTVAGCFGYVDLPDPRLLVTDPFLESWDQGPLVPACPNCPVYRWFWERDGLDPVVLRLDFVDGALRSTVRVADGDGWTEVVEPVKPRRAARLDQAIGQAGFWQLEHLDTSGACASPGAAGSQWTLEGIASPGHRAVYRWSPLGTPVTVLGRAWLRAAGLRVRRRDFR